jgi:pyruvate/2-oxoglutarate dehydrogenase complex dihydrolipoamide acyltransferase (E2) component
MTDILMPALSPTMEEGTLAKWLVKEGDKVKLRRRDRRDRDRQGDDGGRGRRRRRDLEILVPEGTEGVKVNTDHRPFCRGEAAPPRRLASKAEAKGGEAPKEPEAQSRADAKARSRRQGRLAAI